MASEDRGKVVKVPMRERDWSLLLGTLHVLARGIDQSGDPDVRVAVKEALVRAGKLAHALRVRRTMPPTDTSCPACGGDGVCPLCEAHGGACECGGVGCQACDGTGAAGG